MQLKTLALISLALTLGSSAHAITSTGIKLVSQAVGTCGDPCVVVSNNGGKITAFKGAGDAIKRGAGQPLVVDGFCGSACMVLADRARPRACITPRATFAYHKTNWNRPLPLSPDLHRWIVRNGPYPEFTDAPGIMPNEAAQQFWRQC